MQIIPLLKTGIDPHVYKPSKRDLDILRSADVIIYHGLHLEGKIIEVLKKMEGPLIINASQKLFSRFNYSSILIFQHLWRSSCLVDLDLTRGAISTITQNLSTEYPQFKDELDSNMQAYFQIQ